MTVTQESSKKRIAVAPGDGIGVDVTREAVKVLEAVAQGSSKERELVHCMSEKSNVLTYGHDLWQRVFAELQKEYPEIRSSHLYVDALTMQMVRDPSQFDVIVTCNMFGDIVTDPGAALAGGLGVAPSANLNPKGISMFEPVHGSAPKYAGTNTANPLGSILTAALMLKHLDSTGEATTMEAAVRDSICHNQTTPDLEGNLGTREVGDSIAEAAFSMMRRAQA
jgi:3-isopropylmalate dehydrogenase